MKYWPHQRSWNSGVLIKLYPVAGDKFLRILNISIVKKWKFINSIRDKSCLFLVVLISRDCFYLQMMRKSLPWNRFILVFYLVSDHPFSTLPKIFLKQHLVNPPFKRVNTSNLMMFECCFLRFHSMIRITCPPSLYYVMYLGTLLFAVQFNVFISLLWFSFIVYYLFLVMQHIANTVSLLKL